VQKVPILRRHTMDISAACWFLPLLERQLATVATPLRIFDARAAESICGELWATTELRRLLPHGPSGPVITPTAALRLLVPIMRGLRVACIALRDQPQVPAIANLLAILEIEAKILPEARKSLETMQADLAFSGARDPGKRVN
jgi:hypothetical protein